MTIPVEGWTIITVFGTPSIQPVTSVKRKKENGEEIIYAAHIYFTGEPCETRTSAVVKISNVYNTADEAALHICNDIIEKSST